MRDKVQCELLYARNIKGEAMRRTVVYLACPMTKGGFTNNTRNCLRIAQELKVKGYSPIAPVLTWFWDLVYPESLDDWLQYDFGLIAVSDCVLRLKGESQGADAELVYAVRNDVPIFLTRYDLYREMGPERD